MKFIVPYYNHRMGTSYYEVYKESPDGSVYRIQVGLIRFPSNWEQVCRQYPDALIQRQQTTNAWLSDFRAASQFKGRFTRLLQEGVA